MRKANKKKGLKEARHETDTQSFGTLQLLAGERRRKRKKQLHLICTDYWERIVYTVVQ
jgi:hypothetical protein